MMKNVPEWKSWLIWFDMYMKIWSYAIKPVGKGAKITCLEYYLFELPFTFTGLSKIKNVSLLVNHSDFHLIYKKAFYRPESKDQLNSEIFDCVENYRKCLTPLSPVYIFLYNFGNPENKLYGKTKIWFSNSNMTQESLKKRITLIEETFHSSVKLEIN